MSTPFCPFAHFCALSYNAAGTVAPAARARLGKTEEERAHMPTIRARIVDYLAKHPEGRSDGEITRDLHLKHHAQANQRCRQLAAEGLVDRRRENGRIRNFLLREPIDHADDAPLAHGAYAQDKPWFWEGNVQFRAMEFLESRGWTVTGYADTAKKEPGRDIEAKNGTGILWVTVKGFPAGTERTHPSTQAGHWFRGGIFDIVVWQSENPEVGLAFALPDFPRYRKLAAKITGAGSALHFTFLWIREDGSVQTSCSRCATWS